MSTTGNENMPLLLGLAVVAIIVVAFFSSRGGDESTATAAKKSTPSASSTAPKKSKKKKSKAKAKAAPVEKKEEAPAPAPEPEPEPEPAAKPAAKKKKRKPKKKGGNAAAAAKSAPAEEPKKVAFADDEESDDDDDDVDLWRLQSASTRKGANDAAKRAAANKERDRVRALKRQEEKAKADAQKAAEAQAAAAEEAQKEAKEAAALAALVAKADAGASKAKKNGAAATNGNGAEAAPAATAGEKKKRKRKKKKGGAGAAEGARDPLVSAPPAVEHWETVPNVEEWQEVGTKRKTKGGGAGGTEGTEAFLSDGPAAEAPGETSATLPAGDDPLIFIGPKGSTIQNLQDVTGAKFHLNRTTNVLTISGSETAVELGLAEARTILAVEAQRKANQVEERVTWGSDAIKAVIGRGGANIRATQEATGVKIDADVEAGTLVIVGPADRVSTALTLCHNAAFGEVQDVMELGSRNAVNLVYGPSFATIRSLQDATGCKLDIARGTTQLKLAGSAEAVATASARVRALLDANRGLEMTIENSKVGAVYGKGGETLRSIQDRTGTQIDVVRGPTHAQVKIMGTADMAARARSMLQRAIDGEVELKPGEVAEEVELGSATAAVIGRGGSKAKELEKLHGVKLNVRSELQKARVVGKPAQVEAAVKDIVAIAKPIMDAESAQKEADEEVETGESAWQVETGGDDAEGW